MVGGVTLVAELLVVLLCFSRRSEAIWMNMPVTGRKCLSEEVHNNVIVMAEWVVIADDHLNYPAPNIFTKVTSPYGNTLYEQGNTTHGQISFTASEAGSYQACFSVDGNHTGGSLSINLEWKTGITAKDWDSVASKEKVEGVELELRKLEGAVEAIHENLLYLRSREAEMRTVSETTNTRVALFSIISLGVCILASIAQILYLKRYFLKKKLI